MKFQSVAEDWFRTSGKGKSKGKKTNKNWGQNRDRSGTQVDHEDRGAGTAAQETLRPKQIDEKEQQSFQYNLNKRGNEVQVERH